VAALVTLVSGSIAFTLRVQDQVSQTTQARQDADHKAADLANQATQLTLQIKETEQARKDANEKAEKLRDKAAELKNKSDSLASALRQGNRLLTDSRIQLIASAIRDGQNKLARDRLDDVSPEERSWDWHYLKRQQDTSLFTLYGHRGSVQQVVYSPDGTRLATVSSEGTVKVWDARTGQELLTLPAVRWSATVGSYAVRVAFSSDGSRLASVICPSFSRALSSYPLTVWDIRTGQELRTINVNGLTGPVVFSADGTRFNDGHKVWETRTGQEIPTLGDTGIGAVFSPDGTRLATIRPAYDVATGPGAPSRVLILDARTGQELCRLNGGKPFDDVRSLVFCPDGTRLAGHTRRFNQGDLDLRIWDARTGQELAIVPSAAGTVAYSPDGTRLAVVGYTDEGTVTVRDARTGLGRLTLKGATGGVSSLAFSPDGARLAGGSPDGTVKIWDARTVHDALDLNVQNNLPVPCVAFSPDGQRLATAEDHTVKVWNARTGQELLKFPGYRTSLAFSPDGTRLAGAGGELTIWDAHTGQELLSIPGRFWRVAYTPDGARLVGLSFPANGLHAVTVWDARSGRVLLNSEGKGSGDRVAFSPDGTRLAMGNGSVVSVSEVRTGQELLTLRGDAVRVLSVTFSPDGTRLASSCELERSCEVKVWNAQTGVELITLKGQGEVNSVAFSPDGARLVTGSAESAVKVWDAHTGQELLTLKGHTGSVSSVAFSSDGVRLASGGQDAHGLGELKIWDTRRGQEVVAFRGHTNLVAGVALSPDGRRLASVTETRKSLRVWDASTGQMLFEKTVPLLWARAGLVIPFLTFSPDGSRLVSGGDLGGLPRLWDARTGQELLVINQEHPLIDMGGGTFAFSPDSTRLVGRAQDGMKIWDARTGRELLSLKGDTFQADFGSNLGVPVNWVGSVAFSSDGASVVAENTVGKRLAWNARTGEPLSKVPPVPASRDPTRSADGHYFASMDGTAVRISDLRLSEDELVYRRWVTRPDPEWHEAEGHRLAQAGDWFAASFHLQQRLKTPPEAMALRRDLALCQLGARQEQAYRQTCAALLEQLEKVPAEDRGSLRPSVARACTLGPAAVPVDRLLLLAEGADPLTRALLLYRDGKSEDALKIIAGQTDARALLVSALAAHACGRPADAKKAYEQAAQWLDERAPSAPAPSAVTSIYERAAQPKIANLDTLPWDARLEAEVLRREAEQSLKESSTKATK
jgi:WD40 repeat protein